MTTQDDRHAENIERLTRLEEQMKHTQKDVTEIKTKVDPISDAFQQAKGIRAAVLFIGVLIVGSLGAGAREILSWLFSATGKH